MYLEHFGLKEQPFSITPDTSFFFASHSYQEALNTLLISVRSGEGFIKITGEVGTGKTLLCRKFMASLGPEFRIAYVPNPYLDPQALLLSVVGELNLKDMNQATQHQIMQALTYGLLNLARAGKKVVVCVDEAQAMPIETLEALRLLTNLETEKRKLVQVVIFGQPELEEKLAHPSIRQLKQRITFNYRLARLSRSELDHYMNHRLLVAGYRGGRVFTPASLHLLHRYAHGIPRLVNILAHKALLAAYGKGKHEIGLREVAAAAADTPAVASIWWPGWRILGTALLLISCAVGTAFWIAPR